MMLIEFKMENIFMSATMRNFNKASEIDRCKFLKVSLPLLA